VADAHLGSDLKAMLSEIERAYRTSDRSQPNPAAPFAFPASGTGSRSTSMAPPPATLTRAASAIPDPTQEVHTYEHCGCITWTWC
jgi:hypothetical protein